MAITKSTTVARIYQLLEPLLEREDRKPTFDEIVDAVDLGLTEWRLGLSSELKLKALAWEEKMEEGDKTLYSLGLRHAIDLVLNYDPTEKDPNEGRKFDDTV
jgi:hypothetical protein